MQRWVIFSGANPTIELFRIQRDASYGPTAFSIKNRSIGNARIDRFPNPASCRCNIVDLGMIGLTAKSAIRPEVIAGPMLRISTRRMVLSTTGIFLHDGCRLSDLLFGSMTDELTNWSPGPGLLFGKAYSWSECFFKVNEFTLESNMFIRTFIIEMPICIMNPSNFREHGRGWVPAARNTQQPLAKKGSNHPVLDYWIPLYFTITSSTNSHDRLPHWHSIPGQLPGFQP